MRPRPAVVLLAGAALLAGCGDGGGPHMARADAAPLIALSHRISREGPCAQARDITKLGRQAITLVNAHRVPSSLAESLVSGVNALRAQTPVCLPPVTTSAPTPVAPPPAPHEKHPHDHHDHHEEKHH